MDVRMAMDLGRDCLLTALMIAGPVLAVGLVIGLLISIVQTVTQIQDQTLSIVPKIVAMAAAAVFFVPWMLQRAIDYSATLFSAP